MTFALLEKKNIQIKRWFAIPEDGTSESVIRPTGSEAIKQTIYVDDFLDRGLFYVYQKKPRFSYIFIFWQDLARALRKAKHSIDGQKSRKRMRVNKQPHNVPEALHFQKNL
jgi:hypothetical protein